MSNTDNTSSNVGLLQFPAPENFSFKSHDWSHWFSRYRRYSEVSQLSIKDDKYQISCLLYLMGEKSEELIKSLNISTTSTYKEVVEKISNFFLPKRNIVFERAKFNQRSQKLGEPADSFISDLHNLASNCDYGSLTEQLIRDRIIVGILDNKLSETLQLDDQLTLEKAVNKVMQAEMIKKQQSTVRSVPTNSNEVSFVNNSGKKFNNYKNFKKNSWKPENKNVASFSGTKNTQKTSEKQCFYCGELNWNREHIKSCPARSKRCEFCHQLGHFKRMCPRANQPQQQIPKSGNFNKNKKVGSLFLGLVECNETAPWMAQVEINKCKVDFVVDCGADISVLPQKLYSEQMGPMVKVDSQVSGPNGSKLKVLGTVKTVFSCNDQSCLSTLYVIKNLHKPLLGRPVLETLKIVNRVFSVSNSKNSSAVWKQRFPNLFQGLGKMPGIYKITLADGVVPYSVSSPRRIPIPLLPKVKEELKKLVDLGIISEISEPTDWVSPIVVVPKANGEVRITTDFTKLNMAIKREKFILPSVDYTLAQLGKSKVFTKLDCNNGFYQCVLDDESKKLTCFITPYGRFIYNRLPQGASSSPEVFSKKIASILSGLEGVTNLIDDFCVHGSTQEIHDQRLNAVLNRLQENGITLNPDKCIFSASSIRYLGFIIDFSGVHADPEKVSAITEFPVPKNVSEVRRFLGILNQLAKFIPNLSEKTKHLRSLLSKNKDWYWDTVHKNCFENLKSLLTSTEVLTLYDVDRPTRLFCDASRNGLGAVLLQKVGDGDSEIWRPVAYASRSLTDAESRYAIIELETLAICFGAERFQDYLIGLNNFEIITDHSPLVSLLQQKNIDELPIRIQRFRLRLLRFSYTVTYIKGKSQLTADALSRAPLKYLNSVDFKLNEIISDYEIGSIEAMPVSKQKFKLICQKQKEDDILSKIRSYVSSEWPDKSKISVFLRPFNSVKSNLSIVNDILVLGSRIVIPQSLRTDILDHIHEGHQGIVKCLERARSSVWWPNIISEVKDKVASCYVCARFQTNRAEPLIPGQFPERPWEKIGVDLFYFDNKNYLVVVDYFSRFIEMCLLTSTTSESVINHLKSLFARYGIVDTLLSDGGPQFSSHIFSEFARNYGFSHITSSPHFPEANGEAERAVQTLKVLLKKSLASNSDPYLALMSYRSTPLKNGYSPAELFFNRRIKTTLPILPEQLDSKVPDMNKLRKFEDKNRRYYKNYTDRKRGARPLAEVSSGKKVFLKKEKRECVVQEKFSTPRSYILKGPDDEILRRNRRAFVTIPMKTQTPIDPGPSKSELRPSPPRVFHSRIPIITPRVSNRQNKGTLPVRYRD